MLFGGASWYSARNVSTMLAVQWWSCTLPEEDNAPTAAMPPLCVFGAGRATGVQQSDEHHEGGAPASDRQPRHLTPSIDLTFIHH